MSQSDEVRQLRLQIGKLAEQLPEERSSFTDPQRAVEAKLASLRRQLEAELTRQKTLDVTADATSVQKRSSREVS